jgi:hypothetical protein
MAEKTTLVIAAVVGAFAGTFLTRYMVSGHQDHLVEVLISHSSSATVYSPQFWLRY